MGDLELAIANRNRIGRLYGFTGHYGTTHSAPLSEAPEQIEEPNVKQQQTVTEAEEIIMATDLVFNRFKPSSVAGRILATLAKGPKTPAQVAHIAGSRSADNIMAPGGWFYLLRKFGKTSKKFTLSLNDDGRLVLVVNQRYAKQV